MFKIAHRGAPLSSGPGSFRLWIAWGTKARYLDQGHKRRDRPPITSNLLDEFWAVLCTELTLSLTTRGLAVLVRPVF